MINEIEITDKLGYRLLSKGIIDYEVIDKAIKLKQQEDPRNRRTLAQILVSDFKMDHDVVFREVKNLYGFREIELSEEKIDDRRIEFIRKMFEPLPEQLQERMREEKIFILRYDQRNPFKFVFITPDPTNKHIPTIARAIGAKRYEICYVRLSDFQSLLEKVFPLENEFLKGMEVPPDRIRRRRHLRFAGIRPRERAGSRASANAATPI